MISAANNGFGSLELMHIALCRTADERGREEEEVTCVLLWVHSNQKIYKSEEVICERSQ